MHDDARLVKQIAFLRWLLPISILFIGATYMLFDDTVLEGRSISSPFILFDALFFGAVGSICAWLTLTWAGKAAAAEAEARKETQRRALQLEAASQVSQQVAAILDTDELLSQVIRLIRDVFGYRHVGLYLLDPVSNEIVLREESGFAEPGSKVRGLRFKIGGYGIAPRVAQAGRPILCNDLSQEPPYYSDKLVPDMQSELAVPLRLGDSIVGVFDVRSHRLNAFHQDDVKILHILADQVAIALENARLFQETRSQFQILRILHDISLDITARLDSKQVLTAILEQAAHLLKAEGSCLGLYDRSTDVFRNVAVHNLSPEYAQLTMRLPQGIVGQVVRSGEPMIVNDYSRWKGHCPLFDLSPHEAIMSVPLRWHGEVFGALSVTDRIDRRPFTDDDLRLLVLFSDQANIALKNSELYEQVVKLSQDLEHKVTARTTELAVAREELAREAAQLQKLLAVTVRVQEEERGRIARDLHDSSNQLVAGTLYELQAARESLLNRHEGATLEKLETAKELLRRIEAENRRIILDLRPPVLDALGLLPALKWQANSFQQQWRIGCSVQVYGQPMRLPSEIEIAVYRIIQESLNNISRHAQARFVQICVDFRLGEVLIVIEDDGVGFDLARVRADAPGHMGLIGMSERAQSIGGQMQVESVRGRGTRITLRVPLSEELCEVEKRESPEFRENTAASVR